MSKRGLDRALEGYKELKEFEKVKLGIVKISEGNISSVQKDIQNIQDIRKKLGKVTITELIEVLLAGALKIEASDIHFEPEEKSIRLRYRVDGILQDIMDVELQNYVQILNRLKIVSGLKINIHEAPQDGRFTIRMEDVDIEIRVSILPGGYGENIVMRILDPRTIKQGIEELGMRQDLLEEMKKQLKKTTGAILTTGPTGSGKTTTLYAFLQYVNEEGTKIITIEDPIEYHIKGISQTQTEPEKGYTFANGLRAIVRQDPDVVLIGEIRDVETAEIALHAALTGHLVFSTLHTNDSAGTIPRLIDLGVKPQIIAPALNVAMAQRLIRQLCKECKKIDKPTAEQLQRIKIALASLPKKVSTKKMEDNLKIFNPVGCNKCNNTGYKGRIGIFEAFIINDDIEKLILGSPAISEVRELAIKNGMVTMLQDGYLKVLEGITDMVEVERVTGL
ncbi:MAG: Flp pilus assembly complex ATPase component TadA [Parcubacteria group bacterium]|nr:Flp pilus assembly complex ATPase component TadA [Parcubacteria group bacterium]